MQALQRTYSLILRLQYNVDWSLRQVSKHSTLAYQRLNFPYPHTSILVPHLQPEQVRWARKNQRISNFYVTSFISLESQRLLQSSSSWWVTDTSHWCSEPWYRLSVAYWSCQLREIWYWRHYAQTRTIPQTRTGRLHLQFDALWNLQSLPSSWRCLDCSPSVKPAAIQWETQDIITLDPLTLDNSKLTFSTTSTYLLLIRYLDMLIIGAMQCFGLA